LTYRYPTYPRPHEETISTQRLARHDSVPLPKHRFIESKRAHQGALAAYVLLLLLAFVVRTAHAEDVNDAASQKGAGQSAQISPEVSKYVDIDAHNGSVRLIHARVIDGTGAAPLENQAVEITAGKITAVGPTASIDVADGKTVFDMTGRTLIPGIVGMHDHFFYVARADDNAEHQTNYPTLLPQMTYTSPRLYLANGVTTLRTTGSVEPYAELNLKREIEANHTPGPHMDVTGPYLQGAPNLFLQMHTLTGPEDARATVEFWAAQGATSFKAYDHITRAELKAAIEAAHAKGLKITGHLCSVTYPEAAELGIDNLEHGFFVNTQLDPGKEPDVCPATSGGPTLKAMDPDGPAAKALIALLVSKHVAVTSTLPVFEADGDMNPPLQQRALDAMTPQARETYLYERNADMTKSRNALQHYHEVGFKRGQQLERRFVAAGGLLLAGPDPTGDGHVLPGFGDQREIELLVDSGFTPVEAIKIATLNGATYLGESDHIGSIAVGKNADLVVIKGDPSSHINDIEDVELVFRDGLGFNSAKLLESVRGRFGLY
jgi:imidazolonepropionase-like amidohydrolase